MLVVFGILLVINAVAILGFEKRINIAFVNSAMWAFLAVMVLIFDLPTKDSAYAFVFINTLVFTFAFYIAKQKIVRTVNANQNCFKNYDDTLLLSDFLYNKITIVVIVLNLISVTYLAYWLGFRINTFTSTSRLMARMNAISSMRYSGDSEAMPIINRLVNSIVYASCALSGYKMAYKLKAIHFVNLGLVVFQTIILNTKATLVFGLAFFVAGYLMSMSFQSKRITLKSVIIALASVVLVLLFTSGINYYRHNGVTPYFSELQKIVNAYFIGPFSAFSIWFDSLGKPPLDMGSNTFSCIFRLLGIKAQEHGESLVLNESAGTNVYTIFKHLVNDYSYIGTVLVSMIIGFISGIIDLKITQKNVNALCISIVISATILVGFFSSLFRYTTNVVACIIIVLVPILKQLSFGGKKSL